MRVCDGSTSGFRCRAHTSCCIMNRINRSVIARLVDVCISAFVQLKSEKEKQRVSLLLMMIATIRQQPTDVLLVEQDRSSSPNFTIWRFLKTYFKFGSSRKLSPHLDPGLSTRCDGAEIKHLSTNHVGVEVLTAVSFGVPVSADMGNLSARCIGAEVGHSSASLIGAPPPREMVSGAGGRGGCISVPNTLALRSATLKLPPDGMLSPRGAASQRQTAWR